MQRTKMRKISLSLIIIHPFSSILFIVSVFCNQVIMSEHTSLTDNWPYPYLEISSQIRSLVIHKGLASSLLLSVCMQTILFSVVLFSPQILLSFDDCGGMSSVMWRLLLWYRSNPRISISTLQSGSACTIGLSLACERNKSLWVMIDGMVSKYTIDQQQIWNIFWSHLGMCTPKTNNCLQRSCSDWESPGIFTTPRLCIACGNIFTCFTCLDRFNSSFWEVEAFVQKVLPKYIFWVWIGIFSCFFFVNPWYDLFYTEVSEDNSGPFWCSLS